MNNLVKVRNCETGEIKLFTSEVAAYKFITSQSTKWIIWYN